jgi:hypothetical protein
VVSSNDTSVATFNLSEVSYDMELVEVSDSIMSDINNELAGGAQIPLPFKSWRAHSTALSGTGTKHKINISESAINLEKIYSVIMPQSWTQKLSMTPVKYNAKVNDPLLFVLRWTL